MKGFAIFAFLICTAGFSLTYTTNFDVAENIISEGGVWSHAAVDWMNVKTSGGIAYGTQTAGGYNDSYALLSGFGPNQTATAIVHVASPIPNDGHTHENELLLRFTDAVHSAAGYECLFSSSGAHQLMRWNGPMSDFSDIPTTYTGQASAIKEGDTLKATIVGNVITMYVNNVKMLQGTDNTYQTGKPGIGFCCGTLASNASYCLTSYSVTDGLGTQGEEAKTAISPKRMLSSNFPNPFHGSTTINWTNPSQGPVMVRVFDVAGRAVATLSNGSKASGHSSAKFDGSKLKSGIYTVRLTAGNISESREILLLK